MTIFDYLLPMMRISTETAIGRGVRNAEALYDELDLDVAGRPTCYNPRCEEPVLEPENPDVRESYCSWECCVEAREGRADRDVRTDGGTRNWCRRCRNREVPEPGAVCANCDEWGPLP